MHYTSKDKPIILNNGDTFVVKGGRKTWEIITSFIENGYTLYVCRSKKGYTSSFEHGVFAINEDNEIFQHI